MESTGTTDFEAATRAIQAKLMEVTDGTYNEGVSLVATVWVCLLLGCYRGDHSKVTQEMRATVETVIHGLKTGEFGITGSRSVHLH